MVNADVSSADSTRRRLRATIGGRFEVDLGAPLGSSGLALTYLGRDERTRQPVAVKTLRLEHRQNPEARARFRREARLLAFLNHPNVVRVLAVAEERGAPWVVLEHVPGTTVRDLLDERGPLSPEAVVPILEQGAAALDHLHARGLVHLDVTPANLLLADDGRLRLVEFGRTQAAGQPAEAIGSQSLGTVAYLAPEVLAGEPVGPTADVYALGCVVYELLTGMTPFAVNDAGSVHQAIRLRLERDAMPLSEARPDLALPGWVDDVVLWALAREPSRRYAGTAAFADLYRSWLDGDEPRPPTAAGNAQTSPWGRAKTSGRWPTGRSVRPSEREVVRAAVRRGGVTKGDTGVASDHQRVPQATAATAEHDDPVARPNRADGVRLDLSSLRRRLWIACGVVFVVDLVLGIVVWTTTGRLSGF